MRVVCFIGALLFCFTISASRYKLNTLYSQPSFSIVVEDDDVDHACTPDMLSPEPWVMRIYPDVGGQENVHDKFISLIHSSPPIYLMIRVLRN